MLWPLLIVATLFIAWHVWQAARDRALFTAKPGHTCANLDAKQTKAWLAKHPETQVRDVRSSTEFAGGALPRAANISLSTADFRTRVGKLDREKPVLVYCAGGFRSRQAVAVLKELDFTNIMHLHRGYMSWKP